MRSGVLLGFTCCLLTCAPLLRGTMMAGQLTPGEQALLEALEEDEARTAQQASPDSRSSAAPGTAHTPIAVETSPGAAARRETVAKIDLSKPLDELSVEELLELRRMKSESRPTTKLPAKQEPLIADNRTLGELSDQELEALASARALPRKSLSAPSIRRPAQKPTAAPTPIASPSPAGESQSEPRQSSIERVKSDHPAAAWLITQLGPNRTRMAGLEKLSPIELANLGSYVRDYAVAMQQAGVERGAAAAVLYRAAGPSAPSGDAVESTIDGTFNGWDGDTIIKLTNGQIWQQASYHYDYHYAYRPDVTIYPSRGGYKAMVEDMDEAVEVRRLK